MKLVTSRQMRNIDTKTIKGEKIPGLKLMEKAGKGSAEVAKKILVNDCKDKKVLIFCGRGNNGGDGFVVGRYLSQWGAEVKLFLLGKKKDVKGDAKTNMKKAQDMGLLIKELSQKKELPKNPNSHLMIDAIFGTGFQGKAEGLYAHAIEFINKSNSPVLSIDVPSGLNADTGDAEGVCVKANHTATMALPKIGHFFYPGRGYSGEVSVIDIGVPKKIINKEKLNLNLITREEVKVLLPQRPGDVYKGTCGRVVLIAGSTGMTGAAALASTSTLRAGAGMAILGLPKSLNDIMEIKLTEVMTKPLPDVRKKGALALRGLGEIVQLFQWADCLALGPGLGQHFETIELTRRILKRTTLPTLVDADGLNAIAKDSSILKEIDLPLILTPHIGEISRLINVPAEEIAKDRIKYASDSAKEFNCVLVFKGAPTIVAEPKGQVYVNSAGNAGMATAGSGDVLTGIIIGLAAQMLDDRRGRKIEQIMLDAANCGVYIHSLAGDLARDEKGEMGMIAGDIMDKIPNTILKISKC
jgi:NAD(P)H-hydrate epimerase